MLNTTINRWYYRRQRRLLRLNPPAEVQDELEESPEIILSASIVGWCALGLALVFITSCVLKTA